MLDTMSADEWKAFDAVADKAWEEYVASPAAAFESPIALSKQARNTGVTPVTPSKFDVHVAADAPIHEVASRKARARALALSWKRNTEQAKIDEGCSPSPPKRRRVMFTPLDHALMTMPRETPPPSGVDTRAKGAKRAKFSTHSAPSIPASPIMFPANE